MKTRNKVALGLAGGALVGAAVGLITASKSGRHTREVIQERANQLRRKASGKDNGSGDSMDRYAELSS